MACRILASAVAVLALLVLGTHAVKTSTSNPDDLSKVEKLTFENFDKIVTASKLPWIVQIRAGSKSKEAKEVAEDLEGMARVGTIDSKTQAALLKFMGLSPSEEDMVWRAYNYGATGEDKKYSDHKTVDEAKAAVLQSIPKDLVTELARETDIQNYVTGSLQKGLVPAIMFTTKKGVPDLVLKVAMWLSDMYDLSVFPEPDEQTKKNFGVDRVPTVLIVLPNIDEASGKVAFSPIPYNREHFGGLKFQSIINFLARAKAELSQAGKWPRLTPRAAPPKTTPPTVDIPPEPIFEVTANTEDACSEGKLGLCVLLLLDGSPMNKDAKEQQIALLEKVQYSPAQKGRPLHFMWVDAMCHRSFAEVMDVQPDNLPAVIALSPKKKKLAHMIGAFAQTGMSSFISQVLAGKIALQDYQQFPTVPKEDDCERFYKDQEIIVEEDDFDLSEIIGNKPVDSMDDNTKEEEPRAAADSATAAANEAAENDEKMRIVREELERLNNKKKFKRSKPTKAKNSKKTEL